MPPLKVIFTIPRMTQEQSGNDVTKVEANKTVTFMGTVNASDLVFSDDCITDFEKEATSNVIRIWDSGNSRGGKIIFSENATVNTTVGSEGLIIGEIEVAGNNKY